MYAETLFEEVKNWGIEKGLHDPVMQFAKINEEIGELAHELTRGHCGGENRVPSMQTVDAIGDILVTIIIFANIVGVEPLEALQLAYETIRDRKGTTINGSFVKEDQC